MESFVVDYFVGTLGASLSIAGLAGLITVFQQTQLLGREEVYLLRSVILWSLCTAIGSLLPFALQVSVTDTDIMWAILSLAFALIASLLLIESLHKVFTGKVRIIYKVSYLLFVAMLLLIISCAANAFSWRRPDPYIWGLWGGLVFICFRLYLVLHAITDYRLILDRSESNENLINLD